MHQVVSLRVLWLVEGCCFILFFGCSVRQLGRLCPSSINRCCVFKTKLKHQSNTNLFNFQFSNDPTLQMESTISTKGSSVCSKTKSKCLMVPTTINYGCGSNRCMEAQPQPEELRV